MVSAGTVLGGRYRLDERIAGGGMGDVWRGTDDVLGRTVAVKILLPALLEEPGFAERFRGEARTMATINHPGVVDVYDYGSDPVVGAYLVMEYVEGDALSRTLSRVGRLTPARTMALVAQAADALQAAHDKGIVHRDVKPGNLLVRPNGTLVLTDFGIARSAMVGQLTQAGAVLGTASYISPEQAAGKVATPLSDVYALGVVAYQCLAGRRPFEGENPLEIAMRHVREQAPPLPPDIPPAVRAIVERAMAKDPAARYATAAALGQVARRAASGLAGGTTTVGPAGSPVSVPPIPSQTSPGPIGAPTSPAATTPVGPRPPTMTSATRPMTGYAAGGPGRGVAAVPPPAPPRRPDSTYAPTAGPTGPDKNRAVLIGVLVGLIALLLIGAGVIAYVITSNSGDPNTGGTQTATTGPTGPTGPPPTQNTGGTQDQQVGIACAQLIGEPYDAVKETLGEQGFKVRKVDAKGPKDQVMTIDPCQGKRGDTITVGVGNNKGQGNSTPTGTPSATNGPTCGIGAPIGGCASAGASPSASQH
jgi:serine/threonine-protein kinase